MNLNKDEMTYEVVVNHEAQYSIWPNFKELPHGWQMVGHQGNKEVCLAYIKQVWTDMRSSPSMRTERYC